MFLSGAGFGLLRVLSFVLTFMFFFFFSFFLGGEGDRKHKLFLIFLCDLPKMFLMSSKQLPVIDKSMFPSIQTRTYL